MKKIQNILLGAMCLCLLSLPFSCEKDDLVLNEELEATELGGGGSTNYLDRVFAVEYDPVNEYYVAVGSKNGQIDIYYGQNKNWSKLNNSRDMDNRYSPGQFVGFAFGESGGPYGIGIGDVADYKIGFRQYAPRATSINARVFSNKPWFGDGRPEAIGDLNRALAVEYDAQHNNFYVVGENAGGSIDVWYGNHRNWTKLQENRDIDNRYSPSEFVGFAFGGSGGRFGIAVGNKNGQGTSINCREFSNKPYFGDGQPRPIGTLTSVLAVEYDADHDNYYVVGQGPSGIDVYYGSHNNWTKLQENRDIDNRYSSSEFVDFAFGGSGGQFGIAVGNDDNYKTGWRQYEPRGTSINCREFSNKPYFGDGKPSAIVD